MIKIPFNLPNNKRTKLTRKTNKANWYVYKLPILLSTAFYKSAGGVGYSILIYMLWKKSMNNPSDWISLPNNFFKVEFNIDRQRKSEAVYRLERDGLIECVREIGKPTLIKLIPGVNKDAKNK